MTYPECGARERDLYREHGFLVLEDVIDEADVEELSRRCQLILDKKEKLAFDWAWEKGVDRAQRRFTLVQGSPRMVWREINETRWRRWMLRFASALVGEEVELWYDQFLAKPPREGSPTYWHQDEGYWGRNLDERGITCWLPLQDVDERNGCMHFIDRGHRDGVLEHRLVEHLQSDLLTCEPDLARAVACPIRVGSVTFHHGKTPHMTPANHSDGWRRAVTTHMRVFGSLGEGDHYPWKVYVNQVTGERIVPPSR